MIMIRNAATQILRRRGGLPFTPSSSSLILRCPLNASRFLSSSSGSGSGSGGKEEDDLHTSKNNKQVNSIDPRLSEWIPPDRPLVGDKGYSHLYNNGDDDDDDSSKEEMTEEEELEGIEREVQLLQDEEGLTEEEQLKRIEAELKVIDEEEQQRAPPVRKISKPLQSKPVDWLKARREQLGDNDFTPSYERPGQDLSVVHHTLLTAPEIMDFLASLGGMHPNLVEDKVKNADGDTRMGGAFKGIIFVSGSSTAHGRMLANSLVEQLKRRKLQEVGVMGARHGAEGSDDSDETWFCIDCHNYIVNIQDEETRRTLNLEGWWSKPDPMAEYRAAAMDDDDEAMDEFVAQNPVPPNYGRSAVVSWGSNTINDLQAKRWTAPHKRVERPISGRKKNGKGRRKQNK